MDTPIVDIASAKVTTHKKEQIAGTSLGSSTYITSASQEGTLPSIVDAYDSQNARFVININFVDDNSCDQV